MPTVKQLYCPSEEQTKIHDILQKIQPKQPIQQTPITQPTANINNSTSLISRLVSIGAQSEKEVITVAGGQSIRSFALVLKNPMLPIQDTELIMKMDDTIYKDNMLSMSMLMKRGKGFHIDYYEEVTNIDISIANTVHDSGSIFYMYITEPIDVFKNFTVSINNPNIDTGLYDVSILCKVLYMIKGI